MAEKVSTREALRRAKQQAETKKTKRSVAKVGADFDPDTYEAPVLRRSLETDVEQQLLFSFEDEGGEVREFFIPKKVKFNITLKAMRLFHERGETAATDYMMTELLGKDNYEFLLNFEDLKEEDFLTIGNVAKAIVLGDREGKAN